MVYLHFPVHLTEEEEQLRQKFIKLRDKRKKLIQAMRNTKPENPATNAQPTKRAAGSAIHAKENAKKLIRTGVIKLSGMKEKEGFKRSKNYEKKLKDQEKGGVPAGFQPFSVAHSEEAESGGRNESSRSRMKGLYDSFVTGAPSETSAERERDERRDYPKKGNTVYVNGFGITEDILRKAFSNFGSIVNVNMEADRNCGFVTFDSLEAADQAISEINNTLVSGVQLRVSLARRQPTFENQQDPSSSSWSSIAASQSQKGSHKDKRDMVIYNESDDMFS